MNRTNFPYEDLIFENRNKAYGAYDLRVNYETNLMKAFFIGLGSLSVIAFGIFWITRSASEVIVQFKETSKFDLTKTFVIEPELPKAIQPPAPVKRSQTIPPPTPPIDPLSFKMEKLPVEPVAPPKEPATSPGPVEPLTGPVNPVGTSEIFPVASISGTGTVNNSTLISVSSAVVDKQPLFPGGMDGFYKFLSRNMRFPDEAKREGVSAKLFVSFVINKEGNLVEIEFIKKAGYGMEESVMAVLEKSPKWIPGQVGNEQVNTKMILPVNFNLVQ